MLCIQMVRRLALLFDYMLAAAITSRQSSQQYLAAAVQMLCIVDVKSFPSLGIDHVAYAKNLALNASSMMTGPSCSMLLRACKLPAVFPAACATAWCAVVVGTSSPFGPPLRCGEFFTQLERNTTLHLKKLNMYINDGCITGIKTQFGYKAANSQLFGQQVGTEKSINLGDSEYVTGVEIAENATCITYLKFNTGKGQKLELGSGPGTKVTKPRQDAYIFGFAGSALGELQLESYILFTSGNNKIGVYNHQQQLCRFTKCKHCYDNMMHMGYQQPFEHS